MLSAPHRRSGRTRSLALLLLLAACEPAHGDDARPEDGSPAPAPVVARQATPEPPASTRTLTVVKAGSRRGIVRASAGELGCTGAACVATYPAGSRVTLTAEPHLGGAFSGWLGACSGIAPCTVELTSDVTVTADFTGGPNFAFVTAQSFAADFGGLPAADGHCQAAAQQAGLPGRYVALLSDGSTGPLARLAGARGWVRPDGAVIADTVEDLRAQGPRHPVRLDAHGVDQATDRFDIEATVLAWTGSSPAGDTAAAAAGATPTCERWTTTREGAYAGVGSGASGGGDFLALSTAVCGLRARLFCFGVGNQAEVVPPPAAGRLAFVSRAAWVPAGGLAGADRVCQAEAQAAGRTGTFRALLATPSASAASRFDARGPRWVRVDGTPLTARGDSLQTEAIPFEAPPLLDARGAPVRAGFWLGATALRAPGTADSTCGGWGSSDAAARGRASQSSASVAPYLAFGTLDARCDGTDRGAHGLLCLQE